MAVSMDTQLQNFWKESINKEAALRFSWQLRYSKRFSKEAFQTTSKGANSKRPATGGGTSGSTVAERIRRLESEKQQKRPERRGSTVGGTGDRLTKSDGALSLKDMRPPSQATRKLLYNGISAHGDGRYAYLKKRKTKTPEEKYDFPILSSCQYGWKIRQFGHPKPSPHARACVIKDSFYRNSGIILG